MTFFSRFSPALTIALICSALYGVEAGGIREVPLTAIPSTPRALKVDGNIEEWKAVPGVVYQPIVVDPIVQQTPATQSLEGKKLSASWKMAYDSEALYLAFEGLTAGAPENSADVPEKWAQGGDGVEFSLLADQGLRVAIWPQKVKEPGLLDRVKGLFTTDMQEPYAIRIKQADGEWTEVAALGVEVAVQILADRYVAEIRIPWNALCEGNGLPSSGGVSWAANVGWKALSPDFLRTLPNEVLILNTHTSRNFLTSRGKLFSQGYLSQSVMWGDLLFGSDQMQEKVAEDNFGSTGVTRLIVLNTTPSLDGDLAEWGELPELKVAPRLIGPGYEGRMGLRYDDKNLYFAAHLKAALPIFNQKAAETFQGYAGGDCLQIRVAAADKQASLCAWYDTKGGKPALSADGNGYSKKDLLKEGGALIFKPDADGQGYTVEGSVPLQALLPGVATPKVGDTWKATFQPWWAGMNPVFSVIGGTTMLEQRGALSFAYEMPADGEVSLGVYDKQGQLLRWLTRGEFRPAGQNEEFWDGLDQYGNPLAVGEYVVRALIRPPLELDYQMTLGNPGNPPWITSDGKGDWLSDESNPQAAVTDGKWVYLASPGAEKGFAVIGVDENGKKQWGFQGHGPMPRSAALALDGDYLYMLYSGPQLTDTTMRYDNVKKNAEGRALLLCLDRKTGKPAGFSKATPFLKVATWPYREEVSYLWDLRRDKNFTPGNYGGQPRYYNNDIGESTNALGIAAAGGKIYISLFYENRLLVLDAATGKEIGEIPLTAPVGLAPLKDNALLAVSGTQVVRVDLADGKVSPVITQGLVAPHSLTTDKSGNIYVSDWKDSFQVKVFSPNGQFVRAIGKEGGRPWSGKWEDDGMLLPRGVAVTDDGKLWVTEDDGTPKRVSVWDAQTGSFLKDYIGPTPYGGGGLFWLDPEDPTTGYVLGTRFKLDYDKKTYSPESIMFRKKDKDQVFMPHGHTGHNLAKPMTINGKKYVMFTDFRELVLLQQKGDEYVPIAAIGGREEGHHTVDGTDITVWDSDVGRHKYFNYLPEFFRGKLNVNYSWSDLNGDGIVQPDEMRWADAQKRGEAHVEGRQGSKMGIWGSAMDSEGSVYFATQSKDMRQIFRLDPERWTEDGVPVYDINKAKPIIQERDPKGTVNGLYINAENKLFVSYNYEFWHGPVHPDALACHDRDGKKLWGIATPRDRKSEKELENDVVMENVVGDFTVPEVGNVVGTWLWHGGFKPYLITSDGLYVDAPLEPGKIGPKSTWDESFKYYYQSPDGTPWIINGASTGDHLLKIKGLEQAKRLELPLVLSEEDVQRAEKQRNLPKQKTVPPPIVRVNWEGEKPAVDGQLSDWNMDEGVSYRSQSGKLVKTALKRDADKLYLAYEVEDETPMVNLGGNWQTLFLTGDTAELMLATNPQADVNRGQAVEGDLRLLFSTFQDQPIAVMYRPVAKDGGDAAQLMAARFDDIRKVPSAEVAIQRFANGYTLEASVPLADLGVDPTMTEALRGDVGVVYSDAAGRDRTERLYYYNKQTGTVSDLTSEATLAPREWGKVELPVGRNLVKNGGFEGGLTPTIATGWAVTDARNDAEAEIVAESPHSGKSSLRLRVVKPVEYAPEASQENDYAKFLKSANGGTGGAYARVTQDIPVEGGKNYTLRIRYRTEDLKSEVKIKKGDAEERGGGFLQVWLNWIGSKEGEVRHIWVTNEQQNTHEWKVLDNAQSTYQTVALPYPAPASATAARVGINVTATAPGIMPIIHIDDVELVEVPAKE